MELWNLMGEIKKMGVSDVCPTVDAIRAFLEHLVDPMLAEIPILDDPPLSQQQKVAKQVFLFIYLETFVMAIQRLINI